MSFETHFHKKRILSPSVPEDPPQNVEILAIDSTALHLSWREPSIPNGVIVAYHVSYNVSSSEEKALDTNTTKNVTVAGLDEYTVYEFVLYASTRIGDGPSTTILGRTNESCKQSYVLLCEQLSDVTREKKLSILNGNYRSAFSSEGCSSVQCWKAICICVLDPSIQPRS